MKTKSTVYSLVNHRNDVFNKTRKFYGVILVIYYVADY